MRKDVDQAIPSDCQQHGTRHLIQCKNSRDASYMQRKRPPGGLCSAQQLPTYINSRVPHPCLYPPGCQHTLLSSPAAANPAPPYSLSLTSLSCSGKRSWTQHDGGDSNITKVTTALWQQLQQKCCAAEDGLCAVAHNSRISSVSCTVVFWTHHAVLLVSDTLSETVPGSSLTEVKSSVVEKTS